MSFDNELNLYRNLSGTGLVPALLSRRDDTVTLEKIDGITLSERLESSCSGPERLSEALFSWFSSFEDTYREKSGAFLVNDDLNPRNILLRDGRAVRIDFEKTHPGTSLEACSALLSMILSLDLPKPRKESLFEGLLEAAAAHYRLDEAALRRDCGERALKTARRRLRMKAVRQSSCGILAGGKGSRMGGADKSSLILGGYTFMERILHTMDFFDRVLISSNGPLSVPYPRIPDIHTDIGPLGAVHALLSACETEHLFTVPCDTPLLDRETVFEMYLSLTEEDDAVVLRCSGRDYPVIGIYRKRVLTAVESVIREGRYSMKRLLDSISVRYFDISDENRVLNVNSPEDYRHLKAAFEGMTH